MSVGVGERLLSCSDVLCATLGLLLQSVIDVLVATERVSVKEASTI